MRVFRILKSKHAASPLSGDGARLVGGRWNSPGRPVVYTEGSLALAQLEILVHLPDPGMLLQSYHYAEIFVPDTCIARLDAAKLPQDWRTPENPACKKTGDRWLEKATAAALLVPSAVVLGEDNLLLNPEYPDFPGIKANPAHPLLFDPRLTSWGHPEPEGE